MQPYVYEPIPEGRSIRVLKLHQKPYGPIHCSLRVVSINERPTYSTISYTWNDPSLTHVVNCDGKAIRTAASSYRLLHEIRQEEHRDEQLWIDAICIYSHRTATKDLGTMRFTPQFFVRFNFTHLVDQI
jgi:hypothetical protein